MFPFKKNTENPGVFFQANETIKTPEFVINSKEGIIRMKGKSIMEDSHKFYEPILEKLDWYISHAPDKTQVTVRFDYFNTTSSKYLLEIFRRIEDLKNKNKNVTVFWYYEMDDLDMKYCGEDYRMMLKVPFKMIEVLE